MVICKLRNGEDVGEISAVVGGAKRIYVVLVSFQGDLRENLVVLRHKPFQAQSLRSPFPLVSTIKASDDKNQRAKTLNATVTTRCCFLSSVTMSVIVSYGDFASDPWSDTDHFVRLSMLYNLLRQLIHSSEDVQH